MCVGAGGFYCGLLFQRASNLKLTFWWLHHSRKYLLSNGFWICQCLLSFPRWMYWTDWEEDPTESNRGKIKKAWMDGSHHQVFLTSKTVLWPNGLSLDISQGILYWVDAYYDRIELVYLNTTERKVGSVQEYLKTVVHLFIYRWEQIIFHIIVKNPNIYIVVVIKSGSPPWFNRWCTKARSSTMPLDYVITNNFCFGTNTAAAASTN